MRTWTRPCEQWTHRFALNKKFRIGKFKWKRARKLHQKKSISWNKSWRQKMLYMIGKWRVPTVKSDYPIHLFLMFESNYQAKNCLLYSNTELSNYKWEIFRGKQNYEISEGMMIHSNSYFHWGCSTHLRRKLLWNFWNFLWFSSWDFCQSWKPFCYSLTWGPSVILQ